MLQFLWQWQQADVWQTAMTEDHYLAAQLK